MRGVRFFTILREILGYFVCVGVWVIKKCDIIN